MADPDRACVHLNFTAVVAVNRLDATDTTPAKAYSADVRIECADCGEPFRFIGAPAGLLPTQPCVSVDETELHAPIRPASSDPDFGLGIPGFAVRWYFDPGPWFEANFYGTCSRCQEPFEPGMRIRADGGHGWECCP